MEENLMMPRLLWVSKSMSLQDVHLAVFKHFRGVLAQWVDWKDKDTRLAPARTHKYDLRRDLVDFPYRPEGWAFDRPFTRADFESLSDAAAFEMCMPGVI